MILAETKMALGRIAALIAVLLSLSSSVRAAGNVISDFGGLSGFQSATWVAKDLRLYEKFGLDVELVMITGGARSVAALLGGSTQFGTGSATAPLLAAARARTSSS